ncbi:MAG: hypothetical protein V4723_16115 [Pseudomonadota bacterium]
MKLFLRQLAALFACTLMLTACQDRHEPVKPTVAASPSQYGA